MLTGHDSDSDEILGLNQFWVEAPTLSELEQALSGKNGRKVRVVTSSN